MFKPQTPENESGPKQLDFNSLIDHVQHQQSDPEDWRKIEIGDEVKILLHQHALKKFIEILPEQLKQGDIESKEIYGYEGEEEDLWCCNGADVEIGLLGGCKSNQS